MSDIGKIKAPLFFLGLVILLVNDFYLKYEFHNELTGKLSDFAGLFIFPYFFSAVRPQSKNAIYLATAVVFFIWKSPISQPLIEFCNSLGVAANRTVDYTDLLAIFILPLSYCYFMNRNCGYENHRKPLTTATLALISLFSFCATTLKRQEVEILVDTDKLFILTLSEEEVFNRLSPANTNTVSFLGNSGDSLYYLHFDIPDLKADVKAAAEIYRLGPDRTAIKLDSVTTAFVTGGLFNSVDQDDLGRMKMLKPAKLEEYFLKYFIRKLEKNPTENYLYYETRSIQRVNKKIN
ncbi:hypothetical protein [Rufibacter roseolus]|uniref:hypothetical protein n=1 Tax=Rufibacter roseolus TaxID=2817375 RepID=UPI001B30B079|nr:hypothetical protein [Rufibacter roseolus]